MKKILVIYPGFPHYRNGIIEELLEDKENEYFFIGDDNMMGTSIKPYDFKGNEKFFNAPSYKVKNFIFHKKMIAYILKNDFDSYIFHSSPFWITILISFFILKLKGKKCYNWTHGLLKDEDSFKSKFYLNFYKLFDGIILYGNGAKKNMINKGFPKEKLTVIYNSLNYKKQIINRDKLNVDDFITLKKKIFGTNYKRPQLIFIGRLTKQKKLTVLLELIDILNKKGQNFNLVFVGDGQEKKNLELITLDKGLDDQIKFYGPSYDEFEIYSLIASSDCCVSPGEIGLTAIHSLTYGTPVISHNNANYQMPEFESIIDGVNGKLFEYNDTNSLVEAVLSWFNDNKDREVVRNNCYKVIDEVFNPVNQKKIINKIK
ncbi:glycosyltransferase [Polaribacter sp. AHE13PA]|uniref:glycosyltransferase n=1 Tax=Polaribacter sp. AHE13PA TaxID=2745562 RepID=UPI001C4F976C|nr:glycosyltransferase [Polaribacter sp. AHE13PA]QXP66974.1 glycosyltransferase [Polaribacter sp. AHE13PA]